MSVTEAIAGIQGNDVKAVRAELKSTLARAKLLAAGLEYQLSVAGKPTDEADNAASSISEALGAVE